MSSIEQQIRTFGFAEVLVVLDDAIATGASLRRAPLSSKIAAKVVPVLESRTVRVLTSVVKGLQSNFITPEASQDSSLLSAAVNHISMMAQPPARLFPNLGVMLGCVDRSGLKSLRADARVRKVAAPPVFSLIRPTSRRATRSISELTWGIRKLNAEELWKQGLTGKGVLVGHLDTGVDGRHPALKKAIAHFAEFDFMGFETSPSPAAHDTGDHGTHTAGTIAGRAVKGKHIGIAPGAEIASGLVIEGGNARARILAGMDWAVGQSVRILNMSLGFRGYHEDFATITGILRARNVLPVFAVGNEGPGTSRSPGNYGNVLSVGASSRRNRVADFSSSQHFKRKADPFVPDIVAPGVSVVSAKPGGGYQSMNGSSMATPHISGLAALLWESRPHSVAGEIEQAILESCTRPATMPRDRANRGYPDAVTALQFLESLP